MSERLLLLEKNNWWTCHGVSANKNTCQKTHLQKYPWKTIITIHRKQQMTNSMKKIEAHRKIPSYPVFSFANISPDVHSLLDSSTFASTSHTVADGILLVRGVQVGDIASPHPLTGAWLWLFTGVVPHILCFVGYNEK